MTKLTVSRLRAYSPRMRFDVVIPTFERPGLLRETVDSALAQSADGVRVTVADNASGDGTPETVAEYGDRVRSVRFDDHLPYQGNLSRSKDLIYVLHGPATPEIYALYPHDAPPACRA